MRAFIHTTPASAEYYFKEGCHILELHNESQDPDVSVARARVEPGARTRLHRLVEITERYLVLEGRGEVRVGDLPKQPVGPGTVVVIPPGVDQCIENSGSVPLVFLAICTPRFRAEAYEDSAFS